MKRLILLFIFLSIIGSIKADLKIKKIVIPVHKNSTNLASLDIDLWTPGMIFPPTIFTQNRFNAAMAVGWNPITVKGNVVFKFIWDPDSVIPNDSFRLRIVVETDTTYENDPFNGYSYELYSNMGFDAHIGTQVRFWKQPWGYSDWFDTPVGIGIDGNLRIAKNGRLPLGDEILQGEDDLTLSSIGADVFTPGGQGKILEYMRLRGQSQLGKSDLNDRKFRKDSIRIYPRIKDGGSGSESSTLSTILGLLSLLDVKFGFVYKLTHGEIKAEIVATYPYSVSPGIRTWSSQGETLSVWVHVNSHAQPGQTGFITLMSPDHAHYAPYYVVDYYWRGYEAIDVLGQEIVRFESDWKVGSGSPLEFMLNNPRPAIEIPISGEVHPDLVLRADRLEFDNRIVRPIGEDTLEGPEVGGVTWFFVRVYNAGTGAAHGFTWMVQFPDTTYIFRDTLTTLNPLTWATLSFNKSWTESGDFPVKVIIVPNPADSELNYNDDTLIIPVHVRKHRKTLLIALVDSADTILPSDSLYSKIVVIGQNFKGLAEPIATPYECWALPVPEDEQVNITAIPDTNHSELLNVTVSLDLDTVSSDPYWIYLPSYGKGVIEGYVYLPNNIPAESAAVNFENLRVVYTDSSGYFKLDSVPQNNFINDAPYRLYISYCGCKTDTDSLFVSKFDTVTLTYNLALFDTVPPFGILNIPDTVAQTFSFTVTARDTFTPTGDTLPPLKIYIRDQSSSWQSYDFGMNFTRTFQWTLHTRTSENEIDTLFVKFEDHAGNVSDSIMHTLLVDQHGPFGHFTINNGDTITTNPTIQINVTIDSTVSPVKEVIINGDNGAYTYVYSQGGVYSYSLGSTFGKHEIIVMFRDSLGVVSPALKDTIFLDYYGAIHINGDSQYTNSDTVNLTIDAIGIVASNANGSDSLGEAPLAQSFIPHTEYISGVIVCFAHADSGIKVALYTTRFDSVNSFDYVPDSALIVDTLRDNSYCNTRITFPQPVHVEPDSLYMIVIYQDSLSETDIDMRVIYGSDDNYDEGHLYGTGGGIIWYQVGGDMVFSVFGTPDSMRISNYSDFSVGTGWMPFQSSYNGWIIPSTPGLRRVYAQVMLNNEARTFYDDIFFDNIGIDTAWAELLNQKGYLETTRCTLRLYAHDSGSGIDAYDINGHGWTSVPSEQPFITYFEVDSGAPGPRTINVRFRDFAGNIYNVSPITIDYDPHGPSGSLSLEDGWDSTLTVNVHVNLDKYKGKTITVDSLRLTTDRTSWGPWGRFVSDTVFTFSSVGNVVLYAQLMDNHGKISTIFGTAFIDTTPPYNPFRVLDEGDTTSNHDTLRFSWSCYGDPESGLDHFEVYVTTSPDTNEPIVASQEISDINQRSCTITGHFYGDTVYYAYVKAYNRVGLASSSGFSNGIRIINGISHFHLISPADGDTFFNGDTIPLVWHKPFDDLSTIVSYRVYIDSELVAEIHDTIYSFVVDSNGDHSWYVIACDSLGDIRKSDETFSFNVQPFVPPNTPTIVTPEDTMINTDTVRFVWSSGTKSPEISFGIKDKEETKFKAIKDKYPEFGVNYTLEISTDSFFNNVVETFVTTDTTTLINLSEGHFYWHVRASNPAGTSSWSSYARFAVDTTKPSNPHIIFPRRSTLFSDTVQFVWTKSTDNFGVSGYKLHYWGTLSGTAETQDTSLSIVLDEGDFSFSVTAIDSAGNKVSDTSTFSIEHITPHLIAPVDSFITSSLSDIQFVWGIGSKSVISKKRNLLRLGRLEKKLKQTRDDLRNDIEKGISYTLYLADSSDTIVISDIIDTILTYQDTLHEGWFSWWIRAYDDAGNWRSSDIQCFAIDTTAPIIESTTVWNDTNFAGPFEVKTRVYDQYGIRAVKLFYAFGQPPGNFDSTQMTPDSIPHIYVGYIPQVHDSTIVNYYIHASDIADEPNESNDPVDSTYHFKVTLSPVNAGETDIIPQKFDLQISPNPTLHKVNLTFYVPQRENIEIEIFNAGGRVIYRKVLKLTPGIRMYELRGNFKEGAYFIRIKAGENIIIRKFIVIR